MPLLWIGVGGLAGFVVGKGTEGLGDIVKYGLIAGGGYIAAKKLKVL